MSEVQYKGYVIRPAPVPLAAGGWNLKVYIEKHRDSGVTMMDFSSSSTFKTPEEATEKCVILGKQIIDGKAGILSVADL